jgi:hypothetical protein
MRKGVTGERMVFLVVAVCLGLFILWFLLSRIFPSLLQQLEWLLGISKPTDIELAAMCSMYRCAEGCMSMHVQEISWKSGDTTVKCQEFCSKDLPPDTYTQEPCTCKLKLGNIQDTYQCSGSCENVGTRCDPDGNDCKEKIPNPADLKVCNPAYPVTITLKNDEKIDLSHFALGSPNIPDVRCLLSSSAGDISSSLIYQGTGGGSDNYLMIDAGLIEAYGNKEPCHFDLWDISDSYKELSVRGGQEIKITSEMNTYLMGLSNILVTYVNPK